MFAPREARSLAAIFEHQHVVTHLRERWAPDTPDKDWMTDLTAEGDWIVLTLDRNIRRKQDYLIKAHERSANVVVFIGKSWSRLPLLQRHAKLLLCFDAIEKEASRSRGGTVLFLGPRGKLSRC